MVTVQYMWIDDTSADVIKVDFEALYHGDVLVEGDTSEQLDDSPAAPLRGLTQRAHHERADASDSLPRSGPSLILLLPQIRFSICYATFSSADGSTMPANRSVMSSSASSTMRDTSWSHVGMSLISPIAVPTDQMPASRSPIS